LYELETVYAGPLTLFVVLLYTLRSFEDFRHAVVESIDDESDDDGK
jgi:hypothetical protein